MREDKLRIAISGLAASGKGTIARAFARTTNISHVDVGLLFRAVAYANLKYSCNPEELVDWFSEGKIAHVWDRISSRVVIDGGDITKDLRLFRITSHAATLSSDPHSFECMKKFANAVLLKHNRAVCDGRNAGTTILPDADFKFYASAPVEVRATRRFREMRAWESGVKYREVLRAVRERDEKDLARSHEPSVVPRGAILLDTARMSVYDCVAYMIHVVSCG